MKAIPYLIIFVAASLVSGCNPMKGTAEAEKAAAEFHELFNAEDFETIFESAHADFKSSQSKAEAIHFIRSVREKLGTVQAATKTGWQANSYNLKTSIVLTYNTEFENGTGVETFTYRIADGKSTLQGWNINSNDLIVAPEPAEQEEAVQPDAPTGSESENAKEPKPEA